jgi:hypothetical protein
MTNFPLSFRAIPRATKFYDSLADATRFSSAVSEDAQGGLQTQGGKKMTDSNTKRIAELNDLCRKAMGTAGRLMQTRGFNALPAHVKSAIREKVETFDCFTGDNDPYGEHDFGAIEHDGNRIFWKIDYYALDMMHGSENPADPKQTVRVLTIVLAEEY